MYISHQNIIVSCSKNFFRPSITYKIKFLQALITPPGSLDQFIETRFYFLLKLFGNRNCYSIFPSDTLKFLLKAKIEYHLMKLSNPDFSSESLRK